MTNAHIQKISVSLSPKEINIIKKTSKERGIYNDSAALRQIIGEWEQMRKLSQLKTTIQVPAK